MTISERWQRFLLPGLAAFASFFITLMLIIVTFSTIHLTHSGQYSTKEHAIYTVLTTVLATLLTAFIGSQIKTLLLRKIDIRLQNQSSLSASSTATLDKRWQVILGIGHLFTKSQHLDVLITYLIVGLVTTAIVTGLSPGATIIAFPYSPNITYGPNDGAYYFHNTATETFADWRPYDWDLGNGTYFFYPANANGPTRGALQLVSTINNINPNVFAYADEGVAVAPSAIGTPIYIYSPQAANNPELSRFISLHGSNIVNTSQCVPVMARNPISCHVGGTIEMGSFYNYTILSDDNLCAVEAVFPVGPDPTVNNTMGKGMCTHGAVGQGTIVFGATYTYITWLAESMDVNISSTHPGETWVVTCSVDTTTVFDYRMVTLEIQNVNVSGSTYARLLTGGEACKPEVSILGPELFATAAAANWYPLLQNFGLDGLFDLIGQEAGFRGPPYAFNESPNALSDVLGLTAALVSSRLNSTLQLPVNGTAYVMAARIGSGNTFALVFVLPSLACCCILLYLLSTSRMLRSIHHTSSSLVDILELGKMSTAYTPAYELQK